MEIYLAIAWLAAGGVGNFLIWHGSKIDLWPDQRCPSPKAIFIMVLFCWFGPFSLFVGTVGCIATWVGRRPARESWWTRPICSDRP